MKFFGVLAVLVVLSCASAFAAVPTSPFTECPAVGFDATGCQLLIVVSAVNGSGVATAFNVYQSTTDTLPIDDCDDTLVGILNSSGAALKTMSLTGGTGSQVFGFENDGACDGSYSPGPTAGQCGGAFTSTDPADYGSAGVTFSAYCSDGTCVGGSTGDSGTLVIGGAPGLANNGTTFFTLEGTPTAASIAPGAPSVTPLPSSIMLLIVGMAAMTTFYLASGKFSRAS